jgi:hypothetical protein
LAAYSTHFFTGFYWAVLHAVSILGFYAYLGKTLCAKNQHWVVDGFAGGPYLDPSQNRIVYVGNIGW